MISPMSLNAGLSAPSDCMSVLGPHVLVAVEDAAGRSRRATGTTERGEAALGPGPRRRASGSRPRGRSQSSRREAEFGRDDVGRDALRHEIGPERQRRVDGDGGAVRAHRAPGSSSRRRRRRSPRRRRARTWFAARFTASSPQAQKRLIDRPGTSSPRSDEQHRRAREAAALLADLGDVAPDHVLDRVLAAGRCAPERVRAVSADSRSAVTSCRLAVGPALAARRADRRRRCRRRSSRCSGQSGAGSGWPGIRS